MYLGDPISSTAKLSRLSMRVSASCTPIRLKEEWEDGAEEGEASMDVREADFVSVAVDHAWRTGSVGLAFFAMGWGEVSKIKC